MHNLEAACSETVYLGVLDGGQLIFIDQIPGSSSSAIEPSENIGHATTPHTNALGRVLLASKPWRIVQNTLEQHKAQLSAFTTFKTELEQISEQGFALELEESNKLESSVAAPIRNHNGDVIAAIGICVRSSRKTGISDQLQEHVIQTAASISRNIAFDPEFVMENRAEARLAGRKRSE
jgi:IclR family transcriptional regulator, KDG regulon repressor